MLWKLATFNVNGIRARLPIVIEWLNRQQPDVLCLQETKCQDKDFPGEPMAKAGYHAGIRGQKSYNGVAVLTKSQPTDIIDSLSNDDADKEARFLAVKVDHVWIVNTYVPQGRSPDDPAFQGKLDFFRRLKKFFQDRFDPDQPLIWTGDLNVAPEDIDVYDPARLSGQVCFHPLEHQALAQTMSWGFTDLFRSLNPDSRQFTFWDYRIPKSVDRNLGWRLDHIMVTAPLLKWAGECNVDTEPRIRTKPSDHTPLWAVFNLPDQRSL